MNFHVSVKICKVFFLPQVLINPPPMFMANVYCLWQKRHTPWVVFRSCQEEGSTWSWKHIATTAMGFQASVQLEELHKDLRTRQCSSLTL